MSTLISMQVAFKDMRLISKIIINENYIKRKIVSYTHVFCLDSLDCNISYPISLSQKATQISSQNQQNLVRATTLHSVCDSFLASCYLNAYCLHLLKFYASYQQQHQHFKQVLKLRNAIFFNRKINRK